ncbi:hypothetical protein GLOTRDRAFT_133575 [Gloeophyllum trabeum ATCC 11539]|uniref:Protein kinase domain-containing protein n=1 Tax=Gloeophyllum trabeum (strain ATCC 11539 / FP-39264 / Madison 617) TaxID=670483 RepID=S7PU24_GLOTA|nr:uncharacterized protein GLOTRDRAFT_133575 [Gloeophyllum trabeum ATCC 11539]EPQ50832.1 hypothetical protein GLOTRDRAFT_133575 [Gloeophyllum trabeum ATCC 11539]
MSARDFPDTPGGVQVKLLGTSMIRESLFLLQNAISTLVVHGLAKDHEGRAVPLVFTSAPSEMQDGVCFHTTGPGLQATLPERPPSALSPPADGVLDMSIADQLGAGRIGCVYAVSVSYCSVPAKVPPLVVKVTSRDRCDELAKEAWVYEELDECLQGVSIPRCYGRFLAELPPRVDVLSWKRRGTTKLPISIVLLERLGDKLPLGEPIPQKIKDDLWGAVRDIAQMGVRNPALCYNDVLLAPPSPPGLLLTRAARMIYDS